MNIWVSPPLIMGCNGKYCDITVRLMVKLSVCELEHGY